jgi:hypothetical protein
MRSESCNNPAVHIQWGVVERWLGELENSFWPVVQVLVRCTISIQGDNGDDHAYSGATCTSYACRSPNGLQQRWMISQGARILSDPNRQVTRIYVFGTGMIREYAWYEKGGCMSHLWACSLHLQTRVAHPFKISWHRHCLLFGYGTNLLYSLPWLLASVRWGITWAIAV